MRRDVRISAHPSGHHRHGAVRGGLDFGALEEGQRVGLNLEGGLKGPQATVVLPAPPDAPVP